jgi:hypothetical protein
MADQQDYDLHTLQEEAIRRAREMQARAQIPTRAPVYSPSRGQPRAARPEERETPPVQEAQPREDPPRAQPPQPEQDSREPKPDPPPSAPSSAANLFDALTKDGDRSLILVLILILMEDKADMTLVFALMYLLL